MATFPTSLPAALRSGYGLTQQSQTIRTDMETGSPRVRRRSAVRIDHIDVGWVFTDTQMDTFRTWFDSSADCAGGAAWFTLTLKSGDGSSVSAEARFMKDWQAQLTAAAIWNVTAQLEVRYA